ncbi:Tyrosine recombinase XerD [Bacillus paralicheniformis]|uniref:tyrosine-type recombinase/integrase n=1 Tax=Bacillus paralicheniformis TaxID=1648923 RepID=UPI0013208F33|nr:tyrosine-type recombinase/integrase [Bacillus paralicheniformis]TWJ39663.1 Tyrosine recombinase XerD [Bacillus paralicheniformis]
MLIEMLQKDYIAEKRFEGLTDNSIQSYERLFALWRGWLSQKGIERTEELTRENTREFLLWGIQERNWKPKTTNSKLKLLRAISKWCVDEGIVDESFTRGIKLQREDDSPKILLEKDLQTVLRYLRRVSRREDTFTARRNYTLILYLAGTGKRLGETCLLQWDDIDFDSSLITIRTNKSRKRQSVPLSDMLSDELLDYKRFIERRLGRLPTHVFVTRRGAPLQKESVKNIFKRLKAKLGLEGSFSPHTLRNYFIKGLLINGSNLREAQLLARHSKIDVTRQYVGYFAHELKEILDDKNPLRKLL